ncbi:hypothetical protein B0H10DRAFT_2060307, partial [Mycena sp. CBHHK59/15]
TADSVQPSRRTVRFPLVLPHAPVVARVSKSMSFIPSEPRSTLSPFTSVSSTPRRTISQTASINAADKISFCAQFHSSSCQRTASAPRYGSNNPSRSPLGSCTNPWMGRMYGDSARIL